MSIKKVIDITVQIHYQDQTLIALKGEMALLNRESEEYLALNKRLQVEEKKLTALQNQREKQINKVNSAQGKLNTTVEKGAKTSSRANQAVVELGRGIQDLPFGVQGVANNITQLSDVFAGLVKDTGSTTGALVAMGKQLLGPAGVAVAISVVVTALPTLIEKFKEWKLEADGVAKAQEAINQNVAAFFGGQGTQLQIYVDLLNDINISEQQRAEITNELIKIVPELTKEDFKYGTNLDDVRDKVEDYILAQIARIKADTLVQENAEALYNRAEVLRINQIKDEELRVQAQTEFLEEQGIKTTKIVNKVSKKTGNIVGSKIVDFTAQEIATTFNKTAGEIITFTDGVLDEVTTLYSEAFGEGGDIDKTVKKVVDNTRELSDALNNEFNTVLKNRRSLLDKVQAFDDSAQEDSAKLRLLRQAEALEDEAFLTITDTQELVDILEIIWATYYQKLGALRDADAAKAEILRKKEEDDAKKKRDKEIDDAYKASTAIFSVASNLTGAIGNLREEGGKEYEKYAIAAAWLDTIASTIAAYKSTAAIPFVGPGLAPVAAAAAFAFGKSQIAKMKNQFAEDAASSSSTGGATPSRPSSLSVRRASVSAIGQGTATRTDIQGTTNATNDLANRPIQTYVTSKEVRTSAALEREIDNQSSI